ncbi:YdcF family protein [Paenibacillus apii]|uniref:YdcF family protein n=1 Tax=Paenibacillus apii TaxID=1850370 RepID=UPI00143B72FB|nr:YdcF family protein [Paenibacillus apii]NJJ41646.1 YdcF family protein [Paenibacillus apii]
MRGLRKKKGKLRKFPYLILLFALLVLTTFLNISRFLFVSDHLRRVDVIIVLSGGEGRVEKAAQLYKAGYSPFLILTNSKGHSSKFGNMIETALALGIPAKAILTEDRALSTYENAKFTLPLMKEQHFSSAIVVSSDFHMRRVKFIFNQFYKKTGIDLIYAGAVSGYNEKRWWSDPYSREITITEYTKMVGNALGFYGPEAKNALDWFKTWFR